MKKYFITFSFLTLLIITTSGLVVLAQTDNSNNISSIKISSIDDILRIIQNISQWMYRIILVLVVIFVLLAAFTFLTAGEKTENVKKAKHQLTYAVIAIIVAILAFSISTIVQNILTK